MVRALVLVKLEHRADLEKARHSLQQPGVVELMFLLGPYDAAVRCEADSLTGLGDLAKRIRTCPGIAESMTLIAVE